MKANLKKHYETKGFDEEAIVRTLWWMAKQAGVSEEKAKEQIRDILVVMKMGSKH